MANRTHEAVAHAMIDPGTREQLEALARSNDRTLAAEIRRALREHVERERIIDTPDERTP
jgi:predicted transcriptional regulator